MAKPIAMKNFIILILSAFLILASCQSPTSNHQTNSNESPTKTRNLTEAELRQQLWERECQNPKNYLTGTFSSKPIYKGLLSMKVTGLEIQCEISNSATLATFKDVGVHLQFVAKTGAVVFESDFKVHDFIAPKGSIIYKQEIEVTNQQYTDIEKWYYTIASASCN